MYLATIVLVFSLSLQSMPGLGVRIPNQDPTAIARGNAFAATADNPSAIYYNPAGITQMSGHNVQAGALFYLGIDAQYRSPTGQHVENDSEVVTVPHLHYVYNPTNLPVSFGLGVYAPFGLEMDWPRDAPFATGGRRGELLYLTINPVVAWQVHPTLSVAGGPTINYSDVDLRQQATPLIPGSEFKFNGDDTTYGFTAGARWQPHQQWAFGVSYRSAQKTEYEGKAQFDPSAILGPSFSTTAHLDFPQTIIGGVSYRPTTNWNVEVNIDWADWSTTDNLVVDGVASLPLNWHSSFFYEAGVTRYLSDSYYVSLGYFFSENSTSEHNYTPTVPDTELHVGSLGVGRRGEYWSWAVAGQIIAGPWYEVRDNVNPTVNGDYKLFIPTLSVAVGRRF